MKHCNKRNTMINIFQKNSAHQKTLINCLPAYCCLSEMYSAYFHSGIVYLTAAPLLAKAGILPFRYEYADNCHRFFTWSDIWYTEFTLPSDKFGQIINPLNGYLILGILKSILILLPFIFVLFFVKRILDRTLNGHSPFIRETEKDLRKISLILIVVALFKNTLYYGLLEKFLFHSLSFRFPDISFEILAMGILSLILSEIFRYGIGLQDEADMTI